MTIDLDSIKESYPTIEAIEKASMRLVTQAILDFRSTAADIFKHEADLVADMGEDITREALDRMGMPKIDQRLFGKIDYKRACYLFLPEFSIKQALFIDSKAEKVGGQGTATLQMSQLSMIVKQVRSGKEIIIPGQLPTIIEAGDQRMITTTLFVKYNYDEVESGNELKSIKIAALPSGFLQNIYNPTSTDTIFIAGRNAPTRGEDFRVRLSFERLKQKANWRVQTIPIKAPFIWDD